MLGSNQIQMRMNNERLVLGLIRKNGPLAKARISELTGLSAQTISVIMRALEKDGLLLRGAPIRAGVGQPSVPMGLNPEGALFIGLKIGRRWAEVVLTDFLGVPIRHLQIEYPYPKRDLVLDFARTTIRDTIASLSVAQRHRLSGIGVAIPDEIWNWAGVIGAPVHEMSLWQELNIADFLHSHFELPVFTENDVNAACGAELVLGGSHLPRNFLYIYQGYFIGGGLVLDSRVFTGPGGKAGAIGSMPVTSRRSGEHQLIEVASIFTLEKMLETRGHPRIVSISDPWDFPVSILETWRKDCGHAIAQAIAAACSLIDFEAVVFDGWLPIRERDFLIQSIAMNLERTSFAGMSRPALIAGTLGPTARNLGAAILPLAKRFLIDFN